MKKVIILFCLISFTGFISCNQEKQGNDTGSQLQGNTGKNVKDSIKQTDKNNSALEIVKYDPKTTKAGVDFNIHDGKSVIWMEVKNLKSSVVVVWEGRQLPADMNPEKTLISFFVPKDLYTKPGSNEIYLLDAETGLKSMNVYFTVQ
jgi:hypothetical protein